MLDVLIIGGGAAGFYTAIHIAEARPDLKIAILERGKEVLGKVKVSGGGRCNVTHAEFDPKDLARNYPRGEKELLGPFHTYASGDTIAFFEKRGIALKIEEDGRMFPVSNSSQTVIDCFVSETERLRVQVIRHSTVTKIEHFDKEGFWKVATVKEMYMAHKIVVATGSNPKIWKLLENLGHTIEPAVPSLFTFNIKDDRINNIPGLSTHAVIDVLPDLNPSTNGAMRQKNQKIKPPLLSSEGPLLITHWGMSGPAILKLSAWGAKLLNKMAYKFKITVNWLPAYSSEALLSHFMKIKDVEAKKTVLRAKTIDIPRRLWVNLVRASNIPNDMKWADCSKVHLENLTEQVLKSEFQVDGKSTFKEEFVTAGGVTLKEIDFKAFESKLLPGLYFAGEVMNIDAITGGFNFQNAWTSGYIAARAIIKG